jgi:hypothetical protein
MMVIAEMNVETISDGRQSGTVVPLLDSHRTQELVHSPLVVRL